MATFVSTGSPKMSRKPTPTVKVREEGNDVRGAPTLSTLTVMILPRLLSLILF
jgi:hypothetical protein